MKKYEIYQVVENNSTRAENLISSFESQTAVFGAMHELSRDYDSCVSINPDGIGRLKDCSSTLLRYTTLLTSLQVVTKNEGTFVVRISYDD